MFLLPFYTTKSEVKDLFQFHTAWIFMLQGGSQIWETEEANLTFDEIDRLYFKPNGLSGKLFSIHENIVLYEIDQTQTKLSDFYVWNEFLSKEEPISQTKDIWRPFFYLDTVDTDNWDWKQQTETIIFPKFGSIQKFWKLYFLQKQNQRV
jgi:hypothetical protein